LQNVCKIGFSIGDIAVNASPLPAQDVCSGPKPGWTFIRGYAFDAGLDTGNTAEPITTEAVESWLRTTTASATVIPHALTGVGEYFAVASDGTARDRVAGGVTVHTGRVGHLCLFPSTALE